MKPLSAKLHKVSKLTDDVYQYDFKPATEFKAGQFFMLKINDGIEPVVNRAYSVASPPDTDGFSLCVKSIPGGRGSEYLRGLNIGDELEFLAPFGHFTVKDSDKDVVLVATGTGLAPFISMLPSLLEYGLKVRLLFGVRYEKDLFYLDELSQFECENFELIATLSKPEETWKGASGRVTAHFEAMDIDPKNTKIYICGAGPMVKEIKAMAEGKGVEKTDICFEKFTVS